MEWGKDSKGETVQRVATTLLTGVFFLLPWTGPTLTGQASL